MATWRRTSKPRSEKRRESHAAFVLATRPRVSSSPLQTMWTAGDFIAPKSKTQNSNSQANAKGKAAKKHRAPVRRFFAVLLLAVACRFSVLPFAFLGLPSRRRRPPSGFAVHQPLPPHRPLRVA